MLMQNRIGSLQWWGWGSGERHASERGGWMGVRMWLERKASTANAETSQYWIPSRIMLNSENAQDGCTIG